VHTGFFLGGGPEEGYILEDLGIDGRIILKLSSGYKKGRELD
jgi:hypothetical protein